MSYNIRLDTPADGTNAWPYRKDRLIAKIAGAHPEILGLQEVLAHQKADIGAALPEYQWVGVGRDDGVAAGEFSPLAIDSRIFDVLDSGTFWLSPTPDQPSLGWGAHYRRIVSWARIQRHGAKRSLLVLNTHWDHESVEARNESGVLILRWLKKHRKRGEPVILMGDFNTDMADPALMQLTQEKGAIFANARAAVALSPTGPDYSFNGFDPAAQSGPLIDHIFVTHAVWVHRAWVSPDAKGLPPASDHYPVMAIVTPPKKQRGPHCASDSAPRPRVDGERS